MISIIGILQEISPEASSQLTKERLDSMLLISEANTEIEQLQKDVRLLLDIIYQADPEAWANGNTAEGGSIDEGTVLTQRAVERVEKRLLEKIK